ncbi:MAG TPA: cell division protein FtsQ/DivIB [Steroidobacteraceae bacterium]|jgi:cell division protein FtsQ|nr:cell division protein FtsQ/DivIB [Steroidobacteraceae bacterium]
MTARKRTNRRAGARRWPALPFGLRARRVAWTAAAVLLAALALGGLGRLLDQPITRVTVSGRLQHVSPLDVEKVVRARLGHAGFVTVNLSDISRGLAALPWVASAAVQRSWPHGLTVQIVEQSAVARWNDDALVNALGVAFLHDPRFVPPELPQLAGPAGSEQEVTARYLAIQGHLTEVGLRLTTLSLDARGAWNFTLDDGVAVRLGREHVDQRFDRFMLVAARLVRARATDIAYVDMRYGNGFAIGWKGDARHAAATGKASHLNG